MRWGRVVVFLPGLGRDLGSDGDGLLGAAGGRVLGRGEYLGPVPAEGHCPGAERAADLAGGGGAGGAAWSAGLRLARPARCHGADAVPCGATRGAPPRCRRGPGAAAHQSGRARCARFGE